MAEFFLGRYMGIHFSCPNGHKLNVKTFLAGKRGVCPHCGAKFVIPMVRDSDDPETAQSEATRQTLAHELVSPTATQTTSVAASPSIIIAVADTAALSAPAAVDSEVGTAHPEVAASEIPPPPVATAPRITTKTVEVTPKIQSAAQRKRSRRNQIILSIVLFVLAIVLAIVLFLVLKRDVSQHSLSQGKRVVKTLPANDYYLDPTPFGISMQ